MQLNKLIGLPSSHRKSSSSLSCIIGSSSSHSSNFTMSFAVNLCLAMLSNCTNILLNTIYSRSFYSLTAESRRCVAQFLWYEGAPAADERYARANRRL